MLIQFTCSGAGWSSILNSMDTTKHTAMATLTCPGHCGWTAGSWDEFEGHLLVCSRAHSALEHMRQHGLWLLELFSPAVGSLDAELAVAFDHGGWELVSRLLVSRYVQHHRV